MRTKRRYKLDRVTVVPLGSRAASWAFAGTPMRGEELSFAVTDGNLPSRNRWEFIIRLPADPRARIEVRPRTTPNVNLWAELTDRSLTFNLATKGGARGRWYCQVALADPAGERSKAVVRADQRAALPHWFSSLSGRMRKKASVKPTRGTDENALVVLVAAGDYTTMIRLFFATKVWVMSEHVIL